ncbi:MAG: hypothetical protein NZ941_00985, partial [Candidatus Caldarchaeum sp.]|nr:hypothetical protein [Candidatus Caldarchaeum sp.]
DRFYRFIEKIAEVETKLEDPRGYEHYSMQKLLMRSFTRKTLKECKVSRIKESVLLILDNSGSMDWWSENVSAIAAVAMRRRDVMIYIAPNGEVQERLTSRGRERVKVNHSQFMQKTRQKVVVYVGDFDGANTPILLARQNRVYWFCPETRYKRFRSHGWVSYSEDEYRGMFFRVFDLDDFQNALRLASGPYKRFFHEPAKEVKFQDD